MKKQSILSLVAFVAIFVLASCSKSYDAKTVTLNNQNDSLNYTLGLANGDGIKNYYMKSDSSDKAMAALLKAMDEAYNKEVSKDEMFKLGEQIGNSFKQQKAKGLMGDSTLTFDEKLVIQGLVNAMNDHKEGMNVQQAQEYIQKTMSKLQEAKMPQQAPAAPVPSEQAVPQN